MGSQESYVESLLIDTHYRVHKRKTWGNYVFFLLALLTIIGITVTISLTSSGQPEFVVESEIGVVAAEDARCSEVGASMLRLGGNAVDGAVAAALCIGVVSATCSGVGGGAFMVLHNASTSKAFAFDMRETAPAAAYENMYENDLTAKFEGPMSMAVPGEVAGLHEAWKRNGRLPWATLFQPAIHYARNGFEISPYLAIYVAMFEENILADRGLRQVFAPNGRVLKAGEICYKKKLAESLEAIAEQGPKAFYNGVVGENLVKDVRDAGGILTMDDLRNYKVRVGDPLEVNVMGYKILGVPPPASGFVGVAMILNILEKYGSSKALEGSLGVHRLTEAVKHMFAMRMNLGDPAFVDVSKYVSLMTSKSFAEEIWHKIDDDKTFPPEYYLGSWNQVQENGTSHLSIVDAERNAVSLTLSMNDFFGAKMMSPSTGILINNVMDDFTIPTDVHSGGLPPAPANFIRPGKRPLSSMTPIIVLKDEQLAGVFGGSGGTSIISSVTHVFLNHFVLGMDPLAAVLSPRVYPRVIPNMVSYENMTVVGGEHIELPEETKDFLKNRGHPLEKAGIPERTCQLVVQKLGKSIDLGRKNGRKSVGNVHYGTLTGVSDPRKDGKPAAV